MHSFKCLYKKRRNTNIQRSRHLAHGVRKEQQVKSFKKMERGIDNDMIRNQ